MLSSANVSAFSRLMELTAGAHGAVVNLHDITGITLQVPDLRLKPDQLVHHGPFCRFAKLRGRNIRCSRNKDRSIAIAEQRDKPFWGCCPFGIWDMAWPIKHEGRLEAVLYLGYSAAKIRALRTAGGLLADNASLMIGEWVRAGGDLNAARSSSFYQGATMRYIEAHFSEHVSLGGFASQLRVHPHHLGKMILKACGKNFAELLRDRRMEQAKLLLRVTEKSVTSIAYETGFQDSNYFSTLFRREEGCSPRAYRKGSLRRVAC